MLTIVLVGRRTRPAPAPGASPGASPGDAPGGHFL